MKECIYHDAIWHGVSLVVRKKKIKTYTRKYTIPSFTRRFEQRLNRKPFVVLSIWGNSLTNWITVRRHINAPRAIWRAAGKASSQKGIAEKSVNVQNANWCTCAVNTTKMEKRQLILITQNMKSFRLTCSADAQFGTENNIIYEKRDHLRGMKHDEGAKDNPWSFV